MGLLYFGLSRNFLLKKIMIQLNGSGYKIACLLQAIINLQLVSQFYV